MNGEELTTKFALFALAAKRGVSLSEDQLQRWSEASLITASSAIRGTSRRAYTTPEVERILLVASVANKLDSERPRVAEIAFRLAYEGYDAPADLVLQHLDDSIVGFQRLALRVLTNRGARDLALPHIIEAVGELVAKWVCNHGDFRTARNFRFEATRFLATAVLYGILYGGQERPALQAFQRAVTWLFPAASKDAAETLWSILREFFAFIRLDRDNALLIAVRNACSNPKPVLTDAALTKSALAASAIVFPWMQNATPENTAGLCDEESCRFVNRFLPPCITALFLALRSTSTGRDSLETLIRGESGDLVRDMRVLRDLADDVRRHAS